MKIVINTKPGWFCLSREAAASLHTEETSVAYETDFSLRTDPNLVRIVERLGPRASSHPSVLEVVEVPDDCDWYIYSHDGKEFVVDKKRVWGLETLP